MSEHQALWAEGAAQAPRALLWAWAGQGLFWKEGKKAREPGTCG